MELVQLAFATTCPHRRAQPNHFASAASRRATAKVKKDYNYSRIVYVKCENASFMLSHPHTTIRRSRARARVCVRTCRESLRTTYRKCTKQSNNNINLTFVSLPICGCKTSGARGADEERLKTENIPNEIRTQYCNALAVCTLTIEPSRHQVNE